MKNRILTCFLCLGIGFPSLVSANAGVPMIAVIWPIFWIAIIPVILLEWISIKKILAYLSSRRIFYAVGLANVVSTLIGIPLAWLGLVFIQAMIPGKGGAGPAWIFVWEDWVLLGSALVLLIPFFFASYLIERFIVFRLLKSQDLQLKQVQKAVWRANIRSYILLAIVEISLILLL